MFILKIFTPDKKNYTGTACDARDKYQVCYDSTLPIAIPLW